MLRYNLIVTVVLASKVTWKVTHSL